MARKTKTETLAAPIPLEEVVTVPRAALQALLEAAYFPFIWRRIPEGLGWPKTNQRTRDRQKEIRDRLGVAEVAAHPFPLDQAKFLEALAQQEANGSPALCPPKKTAGKVVAA
jgi:hypothetical protein